MSKVIGIDLGTTNSCVAVMEGDKPRVITNQEGSRTTPSVVGYSKDGERLVGTSARRQAVINPENTIYSIKRFMGMRFDEIKNEVQKVPYKVVKGPSGDCRVSIDDKVLAAPEISAQVLAKLKREAENYLGNSVTEAVITVPAYFNDSQRQATKDAGKIAGLEVKRIINEPTAAALAYGMDKTEEQKVAVYDLGGGTFDISILEISGGVIEVLSTNGDTHLGGDDVDQIVADYLLSGFKSETGVDVSKDPSAMQRVKEAAERAKIELSSAQQTEVNLPFLTADSTGPKHLTQTISRSKFEQMIDSFAEKTLTPVKNALKDAGLSKDQVDEIIMVGGSTRIPLIKKTVEDFFGKPSNNSVNPDEVVALGAAVQGGVFSGDVTDILLLDVTPLSLGIETLGGVTTVLISRNSTIPCSKSEVFSTAVDNQPSVDIHVVQGERKFANDNRSLGKFQLSGIPPAPRGIPQIEVSFDIDANGILSVNAKDKATGKEQNIRIEGDSALSDSDIEKMVQDAECSAEDDQKRMEEVESRNKLDNLIYQTNKMIKDNENTLPESVSSDLNSAMQEARSSLESGENMIQAFEDLQSKLHAASAELYKQQSSESSENQEKPEDNVVDADFEEVKEEE
jgi:molecular chaperone DnaK